MKTFDEKQRRRDKWNKKKNFHKPDRFAKKKASHNRFESEEEDVQFLYATLDDLDNEGGQR